MTIDSAHFVRYFERVLGVRNVQIRASESLDGLSPKEQPVADPTFRLPAIALVEVGVVHRNEKPSLIEMSVRLRDAISNELQKRGAESVAIAWIEVAELESALSQGRGGLRQILAFGASDAHQIQVWSDTYPHLDVVMIPSLIEIAASPAVKKSAWSLMLESFRRVFHQGAGISM